MLEDWNTKIDDMHDRFNKAQGQAMKFMLNPIVKRTIDQAIAMNQGNKRAAAPAKQQIIQKPSR